MEELKAEVAAVGTEVGEDYGVGFCDGDFFDCEEGSVGMGVRGGEEGVPEEMRTGPS